MDGKGYRGLLRNAESARRLFRAAWRALEFEGAVDGLDGAEYRRVWSEWNEEVQPGNLFHFIATCANRPAPPAV